MSFEFCPICQCPLDSGVCAFCASLHRLGWCLPYEKHFLERIAWPAIRKIIPRDVLVRGFVMAMGGPVSNTAALEDAISGCHEDSGHTLDARIRDAQHRWHAPQHQ